MNLKEMLCNRLIEQGKVKECDVIRHSYSNSRMNKFYKQNSVDNNVAPTLDTRCDCLGVVVRSDNIFTDLQKQMFTEDGNVKRYINSDIVDTFNVGDSANISFPNGYGKGKRTYDQYCCTLTTTDINCVCVKEGVDNMDSDIKIIGNYSPSGHNASRIVDNSGITPTVKENHGTITAKNDNLRIRKLTPKECFRLMGVKDEDSNKLGHLSNATKYHLAGDSIVVNVLQAIFKSVLIDNPVLDNKPIRLIELFAGYGSQALSLKYLGIDFEHWRICEWAIKSIDAYKHIHFPNDNVDYSMGMDKSEIVDYLYDLGISSNWNEPMKLSQIQRKNEKELREIFNNISATKNLVNIQHARAKDFNISKTDEYNYIWTYSFPCQDLSLAGKGAGMEKGSGTRSGMLWEVERILNELGDDLPQMLLMENVPQVAGKKNKEHFDKWISFLESKGYTNKWCMLNAKEIGYPEPIPQNRNRCFMISVLNPKQEIIFPEKVERKLVLKDMLESNVDESYYLSEDKIKSISQWSSYEKPLENIMNDNSISGTITTRSGADRSSMKLYNEDYKGMYQYAKSDNFMQGKDRFTKDKELSDALQTSQKEGVVFIKNNTKQGYLEATDGDGIDISSRMQYHRGNVQKEMIQTIDCTGGEGHGVVVLEESKLDLKSLGL